MNSLLIAAKVVEQGTNDSVDTGIAFWAMVIAAISLVVSIYSILQNRKINTTNLEAKYFEEVFRDYSVNIIPECVSKLEFENGKLDSDKQAEFIYGIHLDIMDIIKYINKNYHDF